MTNEINYIITAEDICNIQSCCQGDFFKLTDDSKEYIDWLKEDIKKFVCKKNDEKEFIPEMMNKVIIHEIVDAFMLRSLQAIIKSVSFVRHQNIQNKDNGISGTAALEEEILFDYYTIEKPVENSYQHKMVDWNKIAVFSPDLMTVLIKRYSYISDYLIAADILSQWKKVLIGKDDWLNEIVNEEFEQFLCEINESEFEIGCFLDETDYEDEYSHNDIGTMQIALTEKIRNYLHEHHPGKYIVSNSWCVHVMTPEHARKAQASEYTIKNFLVK